jgi:hypothetical protein
MVVLSSSDALDLQTLTKIKADHGNLPMLGFPSARKRAFRALPVCRLIVQERK